MSVGETIRKLRIMKGMSQGDVEHHTGMLRGYISRVEHGHTVPSLETLQRFAAVFDVPLYRLFCSAEERPSHSDGSLRPGSRLEEQAMSLGSDGSDARFLLQIKSLTVGMTESDRAFLLRCAQMVVSRSEPHDAPRQSQQQDASISGVLPESSFEAPAAESREASHAPGPPAPVPADLQAP